MNVLEFSGVLFICGYCAGILGAITGLGGGIVVVPVLVMLFDINIHWAMGTALMVAIASSAGATHALMRQHYTNVRLAMLLEVGAVIGAIVGALLVPYIPTAIISILFGLVLLFSVWFSSSKFRDHNLTRPAHPWAKKLHLNNKYQSKEGVKHYEVYNVPAGMGMMSIAGILSGLLGIGSGAFKVLIYDVIMRLPYKVATSTSIFMIGMTAAASAGIYFKAGYIKPLICFPMIPGVLLGAMTGAKILIKAHPQVLKIIFTVLIIFLSLKMIYGGIQSL